ncbi:hypothetical protein CIHG_01508 [Coccidioides immitis H538.4]|uniref:Uncharacterized protein n=1 Tax=Coccidioides immitis H538.4 TaxID=396776 RepID=A0A0J8REV1_COCIT|nr:hypothetical protein CIHG_01508 [Coccidioides immitis H538.4]
MRRVEISEVTPREQRGLSRGRDEFRRLGNYTIFPDKTGRLQLQVENRHLLGKTLAKAKAVGITYGRWNRELFLVLGDRRSLMQDRRIQARWARQATRRCASEHQREDCDSAVRYHTPSQCKFTWPRMVLRTTTYGSIPVMYLRIFVCNKVSIHDCPDPQKLVRLRNRGEWLH